MKMYEISIDEIEKQVLEYMAKLDIVPVGSQPLVIDGKLHRYNVSGDKKGSKNGYYCIYPDTWPAGYVGSWKHGESMKWKYNASGLDSEKQKHLRVIERSEEYKRLQAEREIQYQQEQSKASEEARVCFEQMPPAQPDHLYLQKKNVNAYGLRQLGENLVVPLFDANRKFRTYQTIIPDGEKLFYLGASTRSAFFSIGLDIDSGPIIICEGYATGATLHEATGHMIICAMNAGNLLPVAIELRRKYPDRKILIAADNDVKTKGNPGITKAKKAVEKAKLDGFFFPEFPEGNHGTDWNDYVALVGLDEAEKTIKEEINIVLSVPVAKNKSVDVIKKSITAQLGVEDLAWKFNSREAVEQVQFAAGLFPIGKLSIIASSTGIGKSWFIQRIATDLSNGGSVFDGLAYSEPMRILFFAGEGGRNQMIRRGRIAGWTPRQENFLIVDAISTNIQGVSLMLDDPQGKVNIYKLVEKISPDIVIFDSLLSFHAVDESDYKAMKPLIMWLLKLAEDKKIAIVAVHHQRKPKRSEQKIPASQDDIIGTSVFARLAAFCCA
jgi:putative DNA primase/helicase